MNNTMQLYIDDNNEVKGYPITTPDRVIDENGVSVKKRLKNNVKFDIVGKGEGIPGIDGKYDDTELKKQINTIDTEISGARNGEENLGKTIRKINEQLDNSVNQLTTITKLDTKIIKNKDKIKTSILENLKYEIYGDLEVIVPNKEQYISPTNIATLSVKPNTFVVKQTDDNENSETHSITAMATMLPFDYITSEGREVHYTRFRELDGTENWKLASWGEEINGSKLFYMPIEATDNMEVFCTHFTWSISSNNRTFRNIFIQNKTVCIRADYLTVNDFTNFLSVQKTNGTPVQFYYGYTEQPLKDFTIEVPQIKPIANELVIEVSNSNLFKIHYKNIDIVTDKMVECFNIKNIVDTQAINDAKDLVAHVSSITHSENGWMYCTYLCDKANLTEASTNEQTEIWLARWNLATPNQIDRFKVCYWGEQINYWTLSGRAPYNPNIEYVDGKIRIWVDVYANNKWWIGYFQFDTKTDTFLTDVNNGNRKLFLTCNITNPSTSNVFEMNKDRISELYSELGISTPSSVGQFICKHVYNNGKYYIMFTGSSKGLLLSTINFKNYTLVSCFNNEHKYNSCAEASIEFIDSDTMLMLMRSMGGIYSIKYKLSTNTWYDYENISKVESRPMLVKFNNKIYGVYNIETDQTLSIVDRKTVAVSLFKDDKWQNLSITTYPFPIHYFSYYRIEDIVYICFTSGKKFVKSGSAYNGTNTIQITKAFN